MVFLDAGQVSQDVNPLDSTLRFGAGTGVRYYTPIGPIRLDIGVPINREGAVTTYGKVPDTSITRNRGDAFEIYIGLGQSILMRRLLRISAWAVGSVLAQILILWCALLIIGNTESGRAFVVRTTARLTDGHVQLAGINGSFPAALDLDRLQLSDDHGVWLDAEHISLRWSPIGLLGRHIQVDSLHVGLLDIERAPITKPDDKPSPEFTFPHSDITQLSVDNPVRNSRSPHSDITQLSVDTLKLGPTSWAPRPHSS